MIIFGWLCLFSITVLACCQTLMIFIGTMAFGGKPGAETLFFGGIAGLLVWATWANFPFIVSVAS